MLFSRGWGRIFFMTKRKDFNHEAQNFLRAFAGALDAGNPAAAESLISLGRMKDPEFLPKALLIAIEHSNDRLVHVLLDKGADPNAMNGKPLDAAAIKGNVEVIDTLLQAGAVADLKQSSALKWAVKKRHRNALKRFLKTDCGFTEVGFDLVKSAIDNCDDSMLDMLLVSGLNPLKFEEEMVRIAREKMEGAMMPTIYFNLKKYKHRLFETEVSHSFFENYKAEERSKRPYLEDSLIILAVQSGHLEHYLSSRQAGGDPLQVEDLEKKDKYHNTVPQILATRGQIDIILNPRLWEKQEDKIWKFIKTHLRHEDFAGKEAKLNDFRAQLSLQKVQRQAKRKRYILKSRRP
jgi:hypothetical protein